MSIKKVGQPAESVGKMRYEMRRKKIHPAYPGWPVIRGRLNIPRVPIGKRHEELLSEAVQRARLAHELGAGEHTAAIMREMLSKAIHHSSRKFKLTIAALAIALVAITGYSLWDIQILKREKSDIDGQIRSIEASLRSGVKGPGEIDGLVDRLDKYQDRAHKLQKSVLYRLGVRSSERDFVEDEIKTLLAEFGAEVYSVPPEFVEQVNRFILQYQGRDRQNMARSLGRADKDLTLVRQVLKENKLPVDLAYVVLVESAFVTEDPSPHGAAGLWQFTEATARAYGLTVDETVDERLDVRKSSRAASRYIRDLILDFGSGSSVMLALAAYDAGPGTVKRAMRRVQDPIKQRNFWYLYRVRALPPETREYIPKVFAAMIIGRNPAGFGFQE